MKKSAKWGYGLLFSGALVLTASASGATQPRNEGSPHAVAGSQEIKSANYIISVNQAACKAGAECTLTVKLQAQGAFHLNKEYPHKVVPNSAAGITWTKEAFGRPSGDFAETNEKTGVITLKYKAEKAGKTEVTGVFKFAVCSDATCNPSKEDFKVSLEVK